jgi:hypothetical protein
LTEARSSNGFGRQPKIVAQLNDYDVRIVKVKGEFVWHKHDEPRRRRRPTHNRTRTNLSAPTVEMRVVQAAWRGLEMIRIKSL